MPLNQAEFLRLLSRFEADLIETREALYEALTEPIAPEERMAVVQAGRRKLAEYDGMLSQLTEQQRSQASESFDREVETIRERVRELTKQRAP